jgi:hypothetical protein
LLVLSGRFCIALLQFHIRCEPDMDSSLRETRFEALRSLWGFEL